MHFARLILRAAVGGLFIGHGTQKLFGWFGGHGLEATGQAFEGLGLRPGRHHAVAAGIGEAAGGTALALGAATPLAAASLTATMLTAIDRVHFKNGPWVTNGGYEYNLVLIAAALAVAETGPGPLSVDHALGVERSGPGGPWPPSRPASSATPAHACSMRPSPSPPRPRALRPRNPPPLRPPPRRPNRPVTAGRVRLGRL